ncbi:hypothetical protein CW751_12600 [Brumimicrobium salinarum]|uniref:DUF4296 domain-containing protein n=1 Tax=Brumimicrobium salinarum TaxID=2058658 RepID=A0A2I0R002_9FLAO|nr:DUF4296 domain-containing protein [Brumimicrobium salinarum]PKR79916.1 hypothetical protein CW751_12600 [Brumimicrobium salinarum]
MKRIRLALFISGGILLSNCSYQLESNQPPSDLIPKDSFKLILTDIMIVESFYKSQHVNVADFSKVLPKAIQPIFEQYNIDSTRYVNSMNYYTTQQEVLKGIYEEIQDSITLNTVDLTK